jgi:polysaccharide export outer membrane protein
MVGVLALACLIGAGCAHRDAIIVPPPDAPREMAKTLLPEYVVEPPDILLVDVLTAVPLPPYRVKPLDTLAIRVPKAFAEEPIAGLYPVDPDGTINLGFSYRKVKVAGKTIDEVKTAIEDHLKKILKEPQADVSVAETRGIQQVRGPHLVRLDGTIQLGLYGSVQVTGLTLSEVKAAIEKHLSKYLQDPEVAVDVSAYNSKVFYVIYDGGGAGQQVYRLPITGNETILDAVSQLNGLSPVSDTNRIWLARATGDCRPDQLFPVDWCGIVARGRAETNYQLLPGDRLFVQADPLVTIDTRMARFFSPIERFLGVSLLGASTVEAYKFNNTNGFVR